MHLASSYGDPAGAFGKGILPADAARAHRPERRATKRDSTKRKGDKAHFILISPARFDTLAKGCGIGIFQANWLGG